MQCCGQPFSINDMVRWDILLSIKH
ncbi:DUF6578 domain-containing protein [Bacteroides xylanisolvens]|nr:DUF6578 domain-containing protein [Bacteroides xylanisolvens]